MDIEEMGTNEPKRWILRGEETVNTTVNFLVAKLRWDMLRGEKNLDSEVVFELPQLVKLLL